MLENRINSISEWETFCADPLRLVDESRVASCFQGVISREAARSFLRLPRFRERLRALVTEAYALEALEPAMPIADVDRTIAMLPANAFVHLQIKSGAVCLARALAGEIRAPFVEQLRERLGAEHMAFAFQSQNLAIGDLSLGAIDDVAELVELQGQMCASAWLQDIPAGLAGWCLLKWKDDFPKADTELQRRAAIFRHSARALVSDGFCHDR